MVDPTEVIYEIQGVLAEHYTPKSVYDELCPYTGHKCTKLKSKNPPVCAVLHNRRPVAVCPERFHGTEFLQVIRDTALVDPAAPLFEEATFKGLGRFDFAFDDRSRPVFVELQATDTTGSARPFYNEIVSGARRPVDLPRPAPNFDNVYKRYLTQLGRKSRHCSRLGLKIFSVLQDLIFDYFHKKAPFELVDVEDADIVFMIYAFEDGALTLDTIKCTRYEHLRDMYFHSPDISTKSILATLRKGVPVLR